MSMWMPLLFGWSRGVGQIPCESLYFAVDEADSSSPRIPFDATEATLSLPYVEPLDYASRRHCARIAPASRRNRARIAPESRQHCAGIAPELCRNRARIAPESRQHCASIAPVSRRNRLSPAFERPIGAAPAPVQFDQAQFAQYPQLSLNRPGCRLHAQIALD